MTLFFLADGAAADQGTIDPGTNEDFSEKPEPPDPGDPHSNLLSTLSVTADFCYVFLQPKHSSQFFGPLVKAEKLKWLDTQGDWIHAWIPRLRVSGWVHKKIVQETTEKTSNPVKVPEHLLSNVIVITKQANIRQAPTTRSKILSLAKEDQEFWLLNRNGNWYQIWLSELEKKGWIYSTLVSKKHKK
jgi:uncharacterized protein YgiM (DUF1202 family)